MQQYRVTYTYIRAKEVVVAERETVEAKNCLAVLRHTVMGMGSHGRSSCGAPQERSSGQSMR